MISDEDISLAHSPCPPFESTGSGDCRPGGSSGIDFNATTRRAKWVRARHRYIKEQRRREQDSYFKFDPVHTPCRCLKCVHKRLLRLLRDLDAEYAREAEPEPAKETIQ